MVLQSSVTTILNTNTRLLDPLDPWAGRDMIGTRPLLSFRTLEVFLTTPICPIPTKLQEPKKFKGWVLGI